MSDNNVVNGNNELCEQICNILLTSRNKAYTAVNETMVQAYWLIGKTIVEDEQNGNQRAEYSKETLHFLSSKLTEEFGREFSVRTLQQLKKFYVVYPNETIAKYSILNDSKQLFASKYIYNIPTIKELQDYINDQRRIFEEGEGNQ